MQKIKCIIIEDEPLAVRILRDYIQQVSTFELVGVFKDAIAAKEYLQIEKVHLIFLDIHLPKLKGLDFLRSLTDPPVVIVTTAYHQYALEGFELSVADYLMKPISFKRFTAAVNKAVKVIGMNRKGGNLEEHPSEAIYININRRKVKVLLNDILYIESKREYVQIFTAQNEFVCKLGTSELEKMLPAGKFKRIHRSFIISVDKIDSYTKESIELQGRTIPIGKSFRKNF